jgi:hypothetical protein
MEVDENNDRDTCRWVHDQLAALGPASAWEPDIGRGLAVLGERRGRNVTGRSQRGLGSRRSIATCVSFLWQPQ